MKKITFLLLFVFAFATKNFAQCTFVTQSPSATIVANNSGAVQNISTFAFAKNHAKLSNLIVGGKYTFNCNADAVGKHITVTDLTNNVIAFGTSPLTVENITSSDIKVHYYETAECGTNWSTLTISFQYLLPTCPSSTNLVASNITTNAASLTWTPGTDVSTWEVLIQESTLSAPTNTTGGTVVTTTPSFASTGLTPATVYHFYVRSSCTGEFGVWGIPLSFTTLCPATTSFNENFDTTAVNTLPTCWSSIIRGTTISSNAYIGVENFDSHSGTKAMQIFKFTSSADSDFILVSPNLSNLSSGTQQLKFYAHYNGAATIEVGTLTDNSNTADFSVLEEIQLTSSYLEYTVDFTGYSGTDTYIGIRISTGTSVFIDDMRWQPVLSCSDVANITIDSTTSTSATLSWEALGTESQWDIIYGSSSTTNPDSLTPISPAPTTNSITTISGLTENTSYNAWIRSVCSDQNGAWIGPITFTTECNSTANFNENFDTVITPNLPDCWTAILSGPSISNNAKVGTVDFSSNSGANSVRLQNDNSGANDNIILASPKLNTLGLANHRLRFFARTSSVAATLEIGTPSNNTENAIFTAFEPVSLNNTYTEYTIEFTIGSESDTYIGFRNASTIYTDIFIDTVIWELIPLCTDVTEISISEITTQTATVNWLNQGSETNYQVVYGAATIIDPSTLTPSAVLSNSNYSLTQLAADSNYNVWVRSVCSEGNGDWIGPITFNAQCAAKETLSENFDSTSNQAIPNCWASLLYGPTLASNAYAYTVNYNGYSGGNSFRMNNYTSGPENTIMLVSPNLSTLSTATPYSLKFYGRSDSGTATVIIGTLNGNTPTSTFASFEEIVLTNTYQEYTVNFATYSGTDTYVGLKNANLASYAPVNIDNVRWESDLEAATFKTSQFSFYPNPASDQITVKLSDEAQLLDYIILYDMVGKRVFTTTTINDVQTKMDTSGLSQGIYLIEINTTNKVKSVKKLIIK